MGTQARAEEVLPGRSSQSREVLSKRFYEVDPLSCPACGRQIGVNEPPQRDVIKKTLRHGGLWRSTAASAPTAGSSDLIIAQTGNLQLLTAFYLHNEDIREPLFVSLPFRRGDCQF